MAARPDCEAAIQRVGDATWDVVVVDEEGEWVHAVFPSKADAEAVCQALGLRVADGWAGSDIGQRMNSLDPWSVRGARRRAL